MSWLDKVVTLAVQSAGSLIGTRPTVNFSGAGVTVTDDSANNRVNVAIAGTSVSDATTTTKGIVQLAGDIAGTATSVQVAKVNGVSVSGTPSNGQILTASGSTAASWASPAAPSDATTLAKGIVQLAGDIGGTATSVTVAKVNGISVSGTPSASQVLTASGSTAASWAALPAASTSAQGIVQLAGDLAGTNTSVTVAKVNGVTVSGTPSSGQVLTASGGTAASWQTPSGGAGSRVAIDSNHQLVYYCDETSGTTLTNLGSIGSGANLTLSGTYALNDKGLFSHGTSAIALSGASSSTGAFATGQTVTPGTDFTLEVTCDIMHPTGNQPSRIFELDGAAGVISLNYHGQNASNSYRLYAEVLIGSTYSYISIPMQDVIPRIVVAVRQSSGTLSLWLNGFNVASTSAGGSWGGSFQRVTIGNTWTQDVNAAFRGRAAEVRLSSIARSDSYLLEASVTNGAL